MTQSPEPTEFEPGSRERLHAAIHSLADEIERAGLQLDDPAVVDTAEAILTWIWVRMSGLNLMDATDALSNVVRWERGPSYSLGPMDRALANGGGS